MLARLGLLAALWAANTVSAGQQPGENGPALRVRVVDGGGETAPAAYLTLWRAIEQFEADPVNTVNGPREFDYYNPVIWEDRANRARWTRVGSANPNDGRHGWDEPGFHFRELRPGRYRVTAVTYRPSEKTPDPTPYGVSEVVQYDGTRDVSISVALQAGGARATIRLLDAQTKKPIEHCAVRLRTADGMPIVHGHGNGNFFEWTSETGEVRFAQLQAGAFTVQLLGKQAQVNNFIQYEPVAEYRRIEVKPGENTFEIAVEPRVLGQAEIDRRFPFSVYGRVADVAGNAVGGVDVRAATGQGTLLGGGRTTTATDGTFRLYFGPGLSMQMDARHAPRGVGVQAAHFYASKAGWKLDAPDGYLFFLMTDQSRAQFESLLSAEGGRYWGKTSADEVIFPNQPRELNLTLIRDETAAR